MFEPKYVNTLRTAEKHFLQLLLADARLEHTGKGMKLSVRFGEDTPAIWSREGSRHVRQNIPNFQVRAREHAAQLKAFVEGGRKRVMRLPDGTFPFRYASGGVLPIITMGGEDYYCLIYRECFPVGWNLANGATDARHELLDPTITIERELREELLILDRGRKQRYEFNIESENPADMPEYLEARKLWQAKLRKAGWPDVTTFERILAPTKWIEGPDRLNVTQEGLPTATTRGCFLNIRAEDFGIEVDRLAKICLDEGAVLCDGELIVGQLVNSIVGLFEVRRMTKSLNSGSREFLPDRFFYDGRSFNPTRQGQLQKTALQFVKRMKATLPVWDRREWDSAEHKYDLCPVARGLLERTQGLWAREETRSRSCRVFICHAHEDEDLARTVHDKIVRRTGLSVFFSPHLDQSSYAEHIDAALASANCLVAVASDPNHLKKRWPEFEYRLFHVMIRNGKKRDNAQLVSFIRGFHPADLPIPLPYYQAVVKKHGPDERAFDELLKYVKASA